MGKENKDELEIKVFIADEKFQICIPRDESQSDKEFIIRRSVDEINTAVRELMSDNPRMTKARALAAVALQLAQNYETDIRRTNTSMLKAIDILDQEISDEISIINKTKE